MRKRSPRTDKPECQNRKQIDTRIRRGHSPKSSQMTIRNHAKRILGIFSPNSQTEFRQLSNQSVFLDRYSNNPFLLLSSNDLPNFAENHHHKLW